MKTAMQRHMFFFTLIAFLPLAVPGAAQAGGVSVDAELPVYNKAGGVSGNLSSAGSDTLANLVTLWTEEFKRFYPNVNIQVQAVGSSTAPPALTQSTANLGPMSRRMKSGEEAAFEKKHGYKPTAVPVAIDVLVVYVNKDNPIEGLALRQVDAIFSATRSCGGVEDITYWRQLGLAGFWSTRSIQLYGRNSVSGTYGYFKKKALCKGDYKDSVNEQPGSASVVQGVSISLNGIGYSGIGYRTSGVRAVPLGKGEGAFVEPRAENALNGSYPLSRNLYIYVNRKPEQPLPPLEREFLKMVLSHIGQEVVVKDGYIPLPAFAVNKLRAELLLDN